MSGGYLEGICRVPGGLWIPDSVWRVSRSRGSLEGVWRVLWDVQMVCWVKMAIQDLSSRLCLDWSTEQVK